MQFDNFQLDEKYAEYEAQASLRRDSEFMMKEAIRSKKDELKSYNKLLRLYGAESPNLMPNNPKMPQDFADSSNGPASINKILETRHTLNVENRILNFFIFIASVFLLFQFSIIAIIKIDLDFPSLNFINYEVFFHYAYLTVLVLGKCLTYLLMITFFSRIYIGVKVFKQTVNTNVLLKMINLQFIGFLSSSLVTVGIIALDVLLKVTLTQMEIIEEIDDHYFREALQNFKFVTSYLDIVFYSTIIIGAILSSVRYLAKKFAATRSVRLKDAEN